MKQADRKRRCSCKTARMVFRTRSVISDEPHILLAKDGDHFDDSLTEAFLVVAGKTWM